MRIDTDTCTETTWWDEPPYWMGIPHPFCLVTAPRTIVVLGKQWEEILVAPPNGKLDVTDPIGIYLREQGFYLRFSVPQILLRDDDNRLLATGGRVYYYRKEVTP